MHQVAEPETAGQASLRVVENCPADTWNRYVAGCEIGGLFHRADWKRVFDVYGLPTWRLAAVRQEKIVGVLPLVQQRSWLFGNRFVSLPWFDATGVLADDESSRDSLIESARNVAQRQGAAEILLRQSEPIAELARARTEKVLMRLELASNPEELWNGFRPKVRNQVRKAEKSGLTVADGGRELLDEFFAVYAHNMRDLGSPSHSRSFFEAVLQTYSEESRIYVVRKDGRAVGAGLTMANSDRLEIPWASSLRPYNPLCVNHIMYWRIIERACRDGYRWFHFGRSSPDSGQYRFKKQWGAKPAELYWYSIGSKEDRQSAENSVQESYGWATRIWQRLPLWLARTLGPRIIAKVP